MYSICVPGSRRLERRICGGVHDVSVVLGELGVTEQMEGAVGDWTHLSGSRRESLGPAVESDPP